MTIEYVAKKNCTGCASCFNICGKHAIKMTCDSEGFLYPRIEKDLCNNCGKCFDACPVIHPTKLQVQRDSTVYAAQSKNCKTAQGSSSGGIFTELAEQMVQENGFVAGAAYNERLMVEHKIIDKKGGLGSLKKSKYVQSEISDSFIRIRRLLQEGQKVLFTGTPCQAVGLQSFLQREYDNLLLCDIVCHGVNSPLVYRKYLDYLELQYLSQIESIDFRKKVDGWENFYIEILFKNGQSYLCHHKKEVFYQGFLGNLFLRPSCYHCNFKGCNRNTDITIADFWGIQLKGQNITKQNGVSLVLLHSEKGNLFFNKIKDHIFYEAHSPSEAYAKNPCMVQSAYQKPAERAKFFKQFKSGTKNVNDIIVELLDGGK